MSIALASFIALAPFFQSDPDLALRRTLTVEDGDAWRTLESPTLSRSGAWLAVELRYADGRDGTSEIVSTDGAVRHVVERGAGARIDATDGFVALRRAPERDVVRAAKKDGAKDDDLPKSALVLVALPGGEEVVVENVDSFALPEEGGGWAAWRLAKADEEETAEDEDAEEAEEPEESEAEEEEGAPDPPEHVAKKKDGRPLVVGRPFADPAVERTFEFASGYAFSPKGRWLVLATTTVDAETPDEVLLVDLEDLDADPRVLSSGEARVRSFAFSEDGASVAFLSDVGTFADEQPHWSLFAAATAESGPARVVAATGTDGVPESWGVSEHRAPRFSTRGARLLFGTAPRPEPEPEEIPEDDRVHVDVWSWNDPDLQSEQLLQLEEERKRSYLAVAGIGEERVVQLAGPDLPDVVIGQEGDAPLAHGASDRPYRVALQWDRWGKSDRYAVDVETGERRLLLQSVRGIIGASPDGRWLTWWDPGREAWLALDVTDEGAEPRDLTSGIELEGESVVFADERQDTPDWQRPYGAAGWSADSSRFVVHDAFDPWSLDPTGASEAVRVTGGEGRGTNTRFRVIDDDADEPGLTQDRPLLLAGLELDSKRARLAAVSLDEPREPTTLLVAAERLGTPRRAAETGRYVMTRETFRVFPDLWSTTLESGEDGAPRIDDPVRLTDANPQASQFAWGTARPHRWRSAGGDELEGILYLPEDYDESEPLPLLVYFYERNAENLHRHYEPIPHRSIVRFPRYTSHGYAVFVPDIVYREGAPGPSAFDCVIPGILDLVERGIADPDRIGVQGHSWGGYQIAYLVTRTNLFACAIAGAPVSNMTSAYGGIRRATGLSRQFQYERTQSRIGGTLWERTQKYLENSPLFFADRVSTPLLMLHNDGDGAVPWEQGIEYFVALRRLGTPAWLLNYANEKHWVLRYAHRRDYARRMADFLDHYVLGEPAPPWMTEGVQAIDKGRTLGHREPEPVPEPEAPVAGESVR
ncbi:MAG: prolyl oligopeptidase family serine peptidase [Planctomycetota bacterium]